MPNQIPSFERIREVLGKDAAAFVLDRPIPLGDEGYANLLRRFFSHECTDEVRERIIINVIGMARDSACIHSKEAVSYKWMFEEYFKYLERDFEIKESRTRSEVPKFKKIHCKLLKALLDNALEDTRPDLQTNLELYGYLRVERDRFANRLRDFGRIRKLLTQALESMEERIIPRWANNSISMTSILGQDRFSWMLPSCTSGFVAEVIRRKYGLNHSAWASLYLGNSVETPLWQKYTPHLFLAAVESCEKPEELLQFIERCKQLGAYTFNPEKVEKKLKALMAEAKRKTWM